MAVILNSSCMSRCLYLEHANSILFLHVLHHIKSDINWSTTVIPYPHEKGPMSSALVLDQDCRTGRWTISLSWLNTKVHPGN